MSSEADRKELSKRLSYVLRHNPSSIDINLDGAGWVDFDELIEKLATIGNLSVTAEQVVDVVETNDKQRFQIIDGQIRATQGHSVDVDLGLDPLVPPDVLWHGTVEKFLDSIMTQGLISGSRTHVHLSVDADTATKVGQRRGRPVLLRVDAAALHHNGQEFFRSANGVWLAEHISPNALSIAKEGAP